MRKSKKHNCCLLKQHFVLILSITRISAIFEQQQLWSSKTSQGRSDGPNQFTTWSSCCSRFTGTECWWFNVCPLIPSDRDRSIRENDVWCSVLLLTVVAFFAFFVIRTTSCVVLTSSNRSVNINKEANIHHNITFFVVFLADAFIIFSTNYYNFKHLSWIDSFETSHSIAEWFRRELFR